MVEALSTCGPMGCTRPRVAPIELGALRLFLGGDASARWPASQRAPACKDGTPRGANESARRLGNPDSPGGATGSGCAAGDSGGGADAPGVRSRACPTHGGHAGRPAHPRAFARDDVDEVPRDGRIRNLHATGFRNAIAGIVRDHGILDTDGGIVSHQAVALTVHANIASVQTKARPCGKAPARERDVVERCLPACEDAV